MYKIFVDAVPKNGEKIKLTGEEFHHIKNVLHMNVGDELSLYCHGEQTKNNKEYRCGIDGFESDGVIISLRFIKDAAFELSAKLYLFQCLPKSDKMDFIIQKAVELGVYAIIPVQSKRCIAKIPIEKQAKKLERFNKISLSAARQCGRNIVPEVLDVMDFKQAVSLCAAFDSRFIPYELETDLVYTKRYFSEMKKGESVGFFIGPEGGFTPEEIETAKKSGITPLSLGKRILRTETAGLAVLSILGYLLE